MKWRIPGTALEIQRENADSIEEMFSSMFLAGGIVLSQVSSITGLEPYTVQNWVKRGFLSPPQRKRYSLNQLCRILQINMLKSVLPLEQICGLLSYINGKLDEENDDIILLEDGCVDLGDLAKTMFILEMDTKTLCSEDCKGICPGCGVDLNQGSCTCKKEVDPRLAVLAKLLDKKNEE